MKTHCRNGRTVETRFCRVARSFFTQVKDRQGNQRGEAETAGDKDWSRLNHKLAVQANGGRAPDPAAGRLAIRSSDPFRPSALDH
jgi:hypothetical protein